jgi:predicted acetyltransferase
VFELVPPTTLVEASYLAGEREASRVDDTPDGWLAAATADFGAFVEQRCATRVVWDVPVTELWFVDGATYVGTVVLRHGLTPALKVEGGHIGYHVVPSRRGQGVGTALLRAALPHARSLGLDPLLVTCDVGNVASRRVLERNAAVSLGEHDGVARYSLATQTDQRAR